MKHWGVSFALAAMLVCAAGVGAEPLSRDEVPEPLAPWVDWVLRDAGSAVCPFVHGMPERRQVLPVVASSRDGVEQRTIVLAIERNTKVMEPVIREPDA